VKLGYSTNIMELRCFIGKYVCFRKSREYGDSKTIDNYAVEQIDSFQIYANPLLVTCLDSRIDFSDIMGISIFSPGEVMDTGKTLYTVLDIRQVFVGNPVRQMKNIHTFEYLVRREPYFKEDDEVTEYWFTERELVRLTQHDDNEEA